MTTPAHNRADRHGRPMPFKDHDAGLNVPCEMCGRRGWRENPVHFHVDVPGNVCRECVRHHRDARDQRRSA